MIPPDPPCPPARPGGALIFAVEDDSDVASLIAHVLGREGFAIRVFPDARGVPEAAAAERPALILLDGMLPGLDGLELLRILEAGEVTRSIRKMMLSARAGERDKVDALELGADDYLTKPFGARELAARARALLRACGEREAPHRTLRVGALAADLDAMTVVAGDRPVTLTATEFRLLVYLMRHAGRMLSREKLLAALWRTDEPLEDKRVVDVYIRRLRGKIEDDPSQPRRLTTRRGEGYCLVDPAARSASPRE